MVYGVISAVIIPHEREIPSEGERMEVPSRRAYKVKLWVRRDYQFRVHLLYECNAVAVFSMRVVPVLLVNGG